jgi:hypothetical protein
MDNTIKKSMNKISKHSNLFLLVIAITSFCFLGYFKTWYYQELFDIKFSFYGALICGGSLAFMIEGGRFAFMLSSASDLINKNTKGFIFGLIGSIGLLAYEMNLCGELGAFWDSESNLYTVIFRSVAGLGAVIELRLCLMLQDSKTPAPEEKSKDQGQAGLIGDSLPFLHQFGLKQNSNLNKQESASSAK